jgi:protein-disulfide isomerase
VLVEFFDYACPYCHAVNADVDRLLREDPRLKVVWRELPVLGPNSQIAAYVSLGAARQGRFRQFHDRMFALGRPTEPVLAQAIAEAQVRPRRRDGGRACRAQPAISSSFRALGTTGTPTFVVGDQVLQGVGGL